MKFKKPSSSVLYKAKGYLFLLPAVFLVFVFVLYPAVDSLIKSLHLISPLGDKSIFIGLDNYKDLLSSSSYYNSLRITLIYSFVSVPLNLAISLLIAVLLNLKLKGITLFRTAFFVPLAISGSMAGVVWLFLYNPNLGYLNHILSFINVQGPEWLSNPSWALISIIIVSLWKGLGFNIIVFLAGLQNVPTSLYESASIDGAGKIKQFSHITLPIISPTIFFLSVVSFVKSFQVFGQIDILTSGGPAQATNLLVYSLYRDAFKNFNFGYAAAQAFILFVLILAITIFQFKVMGKKVHYQ